MAADYAKIHLLKQCYNIFSLKGIMKINKNLLKVQLEVYSVLPLCR